MDSNRKVNSQVEVYEQVVHPMKSLTDDNEDTLFVV